MPDDAAAVLASVTAEVLPVQIGRESWAKRECLVVRLRHTPGKPIWVKLRGLPFDGEEHRFYQEAGESAAIFWDLPHQRLVDQPFSLEFVSVNESKKAAGADFVPKLQEPRAQDDGPQPIKLEP